MRAGATGLPVGHVDPVGNEENAMRTGGEPADALAKARGPIAFIIGSAMDAPMPRRKCRRDNWQDLLIE